MSELKLCPYCGNEPVSKESSFDRKTYYRCGGLTCPNNGWFTKQEWNTRPLEDALQKRIDELESENKALRLIAGSHSMSELRRNRIMAGDKWFKYPPAPEKGNDNV